MNKYTIGDFTRVLNKFFTEQGIGITNFDIQTYFKTNEDILKKKQSSYFIDRTILFNWSPDLLRKLHGSKIKPK
jgi:hypothetical protein